MAVAAMSSEFDLQGPMEAGEDREEGWGGEDGVSRFVQQDGIVFQVEECH